LPGIGRDNEVFADLAAVRDRREGAPAGVG